MKTKVQKWGNSLAVRIPKAYAGEADVRYGDDIDIAIHEGKIMITPLKAKKYELKTLLSRITKKNLHAEIDTGSSVGGETW
ncbi:Programmed cell death antitoxin MazE [hydrothermal vent metagenome]|uniref:Programmed cell death antitoxin MazE n=1 Tax=hydrothermal vent metagenome TaxID=652676 RepID=A0A3B1D0F9_9ZZZZ